MANASDKESLQEALDQLSMAFGEFSSALKKADKKVYEQWKAGGYIVSDNVVSMYPSAQEAADQVGEDEEEDEDD